MKTDIRMFVDGKWRYGAQCHSRKVMNPANDEVVGEVAYASISDLDDAIAAAERGFRVWRGTPAIDRSKIMRTAGALLRERCADIAKSMVLEQGKPLREAIAEVNVSAEIIEWMAEEGRRAYGRIVPSRAAGVQQLVIPEPVGVVAAFTPWNFPIMMPARKIAGSLAAGCSIIIKAAEETPRSCQELVRCFADAGLPAGVLNLVFGDPAQVSEHLILADSIRKVSFTGSVLVGKQLAGLAAKGMKRTTFELGGHAPVLVFKDADLDKVVDLLVPFKFRNAGQVCISPTRFFVQEDVHDLFLARFVDRARRLNVGSGLDVETDMGPLLSSRRVEAVEALVRDAKERGGKVHCGGVRRGNIGQFFDPTVISAVSDNSRVMTEEPFGPVVPVVSFKSFDEVIERANSLPVGLAAYAFTSRMETAAAASENLAAGMVGINSVAISTPETPFGGVKESGHGQEGGIEGLEAYTARKFVAQASM